MGKKKKTLGSATVKFNDYVGTAAADDADAILNARSLYQIAGLDRERWTILSIDLEQTKSSHQVVVYAFDRERHPAGSYAELLEHGRETGELPVTAFHLGDPQQVEQFRTEAFKRMAIRLVARALVDSKLTIEEHAEVGRESRSRQDA
jgi:hypothetical protein